MMKPLDECMKEAEEALNKLIDAAGSVAHLSRMLSETGIDEFSPQTISGWLARGRISKKGALAAVAHNNINGFTLRRLRPDVPEKTWVALIDSNNEYQRRRIVLSIS